MRYWDNGRAFTAGVGETAEERGFSGFKLGDKAVEGVPSIASYEVLLFYPLAESLALNKRLNP